MRRAGTYSSLLVSRDCSSLQPQVQRSLPLQPPQQYQSPKETEAE